MIRDLNVQAALTRLVSVSGTAVEVTDVPVEDAVKFMVQLDLPPTPRLDRQGAPRNTRPHKARWRMPPLGPDYLDFHPGSRLTVSRPSGKEYENTVFEIIENPRVLRKGHLDVGVEASLYRTDHLYPLTGEMFGSDGVSLGLIEFSLLSDNQYHEEHGTYENFTGHAPAEYFVFFKQNTRIVSEGRRYMLTSAIMDPYLLRVNFTARLANAFS